MEQPKPNDQVTVIKEASNAFDMQRELLQLLGTSPKNPDRPLILRLLGITPFALS